MEINVNAYSDKHTFSINGVSYIGAPRDNTAMFITLKVMYLIDSLLKVNNCLVFAENGMDVPVSVKERHCFIFSDNPQYEYACFTKKLYEEEENSNINTEFVSYPNGARVSKTATVGENALIESGVVIGPGVRIGNNARIYTGAIIKNSIIGDNVVINELAVIGANGFTMATASNGDKVRQYSLGKVLIGDNVEIGAHNNVSRGSGGDTIIDDNVKLDALVHIGHDVHIHKNVEITAGVVVGGFVVINENSYVGINAVIRNRITLGSNSFIGMGSTVTKSVDADTTVVGNPAKPFERR